MQKSKLYRGAQEHKELYDGRVKSYKLDKDLFESYDKAYYLKRDREDKDKDEDPPAGSDQGPPQTWISKIPQAEKPPLSFDELMSTPIDFSAYVMNNLKIDNLTQELLILDMLLILVQKKLSNLERDVIFVFGVALRMFTRSIVILKRVEDLQLGVESYQKKLNITKPETFRYRYSFPRSSQIRRDLPKDIPLDRIEVLRNWVNTYAIRNTKLLSGIEDSHHGPNSIQQAGNPVKEILLKLNLPDHRSILTDSKISVKMDMEVPGSSRLKDS
ncbi:hypothetical protein Tco_1376844 [Tanacetum coccineum]